MTTPRAEQHFRNSNNSACNLHCVEKMRHGFKIRKRSINWSAQGRGELQIGKDTRMKFHFSAGKLLSPPGNDGISATSALTCLGSSKERRYEERVCKHFSDCNLLRNTGKRPKERLCFHTSSTSPPFGDKILNVQDAQGLSQHSGSREVGACGKGNISQAESCLHAQSKRTESSFSKKMITPPEQPW